MSRPVRIVELITLLGGRRSRSVEEIADRLEVSQRTVFRDLAELQARQRLPIYRDERGYRMLETAKLPPLALTTEERAILRLALGHPALRRQPHLRRRLQRLEAKIDAVTADVEESPEALRLASVDRTGPAARQVLEPLDTAVAERREVDILYASLSGGTRRWRGLDPYQVFEREGAWYVAGRCHLHDEPRTFRLDRIADLRPTGLTFEPPKTFDLDRYLADAWAVVRGEGRWEIVLRFESELAPLIEAGRHHEGEAVEPRDDAPSRQGFRAPPSAAPLKLGCGQGSRQRVASFRAPPSAAPVKHHLLHDDEAAFLVVSALVSSAAPFRTGP